VSRKAIDDENVRGLVLIDLDSLFIARETKSSYKILPNNDIVGFLEETRSKLSACKIDHRFFRFLVLVKDKEFEKGKFYHLASSLVSVITDKGAMDFAIRKHLLGLFPDDPYFPCDVLDDGTFGLSFKAIQSKFLKVPEENIILITPNKRLFSNLAESKSSIHCFSPYSQGELLLLTGDTLLNQLDLQEGKACEVIFYIDIDNTVLPRLASKLHRQTLLNTYVINLIKVIKASKHVVEKICLITARSWTRSERDYKRLTSAAAVRMILAEHDIIISPEDVIHTNFIKEKVRKVEYILERLGDGGEIIVLMEDNSDEIQAAIMKKDEFDKRGSLLIPVVAQADGTLPLEAGNFAKTIIERISTEPAEDDQDVEGVFEAASIVESPSAIDAGIFHTAMVHHIISFVGKEGFVASAASSSAQTATSSTAATLNEASVPEAGPSSSG